MIVIILFSLWKHLIKKLIKSKIKFFFNRMSLAFLMLLQPYVILLVQIFLYPSFKYLSLFSEKFLLHYMDPYHNYMEEGEGLFGCIRDENVNYLLNIYMIYFICLKNSSGFIPVNNTLLVILRATSLFLSFTVSSLSSFIKFLYPSKFFQY